MSDFNSIKLDKSLYAGKGFSYNLEQLDPSENYKGTSLEGLDAFARQLKRFDIKLSGKNSDVIDKFFYSSETATLFPEFVVRAVSSGIDTGVIEKLIAAKTVIDGMDYRSVRASFTDAAGAKNIIPEGQAIPEVNVSLAKELVSLKKRGRMLSSSYEALRFQKINIFTLVLKHMGEYIANCQFQDAVGALLAGNDEETMCENISIDTDITYDSLIELWNGLSPYKMTTLLVNPATVPKLLKMNEFRDAAAGLNFHATGKLITPFGAEIIRCPYTDENIIIAFDKDVALEMVQAGDVKVEHDKLIDRQLERVAISTISGFNRIVPEAVKTLTFTI